MAVYDNNKLIKITNKDAAVPKGSSIQNFSDIDIRGLEISELKVKAFIFSDLLRLIPLI